MKPAVSKNRILMALGFLFPLVILLAVAGLAYVSSNMVRTSYQWVGHTLEVRDTLHQLLLSLSEVESSQRGYVITKRDQYLALHDASEAQVPALIARVSALVDDNQNQEMLLKPLTSLIQKRLDWAAQVIALKKAGNETDLAEMIKVGRGQQEMDQIHGLISVMIHTEDQLLAERQRQVDRNLRVDDIFLLALLFLDLAVVTGVIYLLLRLRRLQQLVTVCAWSKTIRYNGQWISIEDYLHQRFGVRVTHGISEAEFAKLSQETEIPTDGV